MRKFDNAVQAGEPMTAKGEAPLTRAFSALVGGVDHFPLLLCQNTQNPNFSTFVTSAFALFEVQVEPAQTMRQSFFVGDGVEVFKKK